MDIKAAIESGDPASYKSCIPVAMDGSCNGLQHYAALALDLRGGASVNMTNANKPQVHMVLKMRLSLCLQATAELASPIRSWLICQGVEVAWRPPFSQWPPCLVALEFCNCWVKRR